MIKKLYTKDADDGTKKESEAPVYIPGLTNEQANLKEAIKRRQQVTNNFLSSTWQRWL